MNDSHDEQIAQFRQSITALEEKQRAMGTDLSSSIQPLRELLAQLERASPQSVTDRSGGVDMSGERATVGGDIVGRDKVVHIEHYQVNMQVIVILNIELQEFTSAEQNSFLVNLSDVVGVSPNSIQILRISSGSVRVTLEMPEESAQMLVSLYLAKEPILEQLHIVRVELANSAGPEPQLNSAVVRELLVTALSDEDLTTLCHDHFWNVYQTFSIGMSKSQKIQILMDYCERKLELSQLLEVIKVQNPRQYEHFVPRLYQA